MAQENKNDLEIHIKRIQDAINNNYNLAIFVGAGISKNSGVPTWSEIINQFSRDLKIDKVSPSDYIKIAQCYFDTHPRKYKRILNEALNKEWKTNILTKLLFDEFSPKYFITTNYDCILEDTANELKNNSYKIVCKNEHIPLIKDKAIIKMHGDFNNKNIVFKENDYTDYSSNFKLVETFIKSIFATSIVLFVGFSADDPNVNQIYQWVKDILKENKQPSYLILCDEIKKDKKQKILKKYLERKDIFTINFHEITNIIDNFYSQTTLDKITEENIEKLPQKGQELYKTLYFLKHYSINSIPTINNKINIVKNFNYINPNELYEFLFEDKLARYIKYEKKIILYSTKLNNFMNELQKSTNNHKFKILKEFLLENSVDIIEYHKENNDLEINVGNI